MSFSNVFLGNAANDGTGDALRTAFGIINQNFANLAAINDTANVVIYATGNANVVATYNPGVASVAGRTGNITLTVNDVIGAASIGYVNAMQANTALLAANLAANLSTVSVDANVAAANIAIGALTANVTAANLAIVSLQSNSATQAVLINTVNANVAAANLAVASANSSINTLVANASVQAQLIAVINANVAAANAAIAAIPDVAALSSNIEAANVAIAVLQSNAGAQAGFINILNANVGAANASAQSNFASVNANVVAANIAIVALQSNSATQAVEINSLRANITASNVEVVSLRANAGAQADLISIMNANVAAANIAVVLLQSNAGSQQASIDNLLSNAAVQTAEIDSLRANITAANAQIAAVNLSGINANVAAANIAIAALQSNADSQASEINQLQANVTVANVEVISLRANAGVQGNLIQLLQGNASTQADLINAINANVAAANVLIVNLQSNAVAQADSIVALFANAVSQAASVISLTANAALQSTQIDLLNANVIAANSNAAVQTVEINSLRANITASNVEVLSLRANAAAQAQLIGIVNANIAAANVEIANLYSNAAGQATTLANLTSNAGVQATTLINLDANVGVTYNLFALGNAVLANAANVQVDTVFVGNVSADYLLATNKIETETFIRVGPAHDQGETWANPGALFFGNTSGMVNTYYQINLQNIDPEGSGDIVVTSDVGNDASNYITMGINNSQYSDPAYPGSLPNDGYVWIEGGNIVVASNTGNTYIGSGNSAVHGINVSRNGNVELYGNANLKFSDGTIQTTAYNADTISANIGVIYDLFALGNLEFGNLNTNAAAQSDSIATVNANVGAFQTYANLTYGPSGFSNANVASYLLDNTANVGNLITTGGVYWANGAAYSSGGGSGTDDELRANVGAYQIYANANAAGQTTAINLIDANIGAYQIYANANAAAQTTAIDTIDANIGAFQTYANVTFGTSSYSDSNVQAYLGAFDGNIVPSANITYDLGSSDYRWRELWLSGNTINLGDSTISVDGAGGISVASITATGNIIVGNLTLTESTVSSIDTGASANIAAANVEIDSLRSNITAANLEIVSIQSNLAIQANVLDVLSGNAVTQQSELASLVANAATQADSLTSLLSNAATQADSLTTLVSNAAAQAGAINTINANVGSYQTFANANAAAQAGAINTINANIGANQIYANATFGTKSSPITTLTEASGTVVHDYSLGSVFFHTSPLSDFTVNFTNVPTTTERKISIDVITNQNATPYVPTGVEINGSPQTVKWSTISPPTGTASNADVITFDLIRVFDSWVVLGSVESYGSVPGVGTTVTGSITVGDSGAGSYGYSDGSGGGGGSLGSLTSDPANIFDYILVGPSFVGNIGFNSGTYLGTSGTFDTTTPGQINGSSTVTLTVNGTSDTYTWNGSGWVASGPGDPFSFNKNVGQTYALTLTIP